MAYRTSKPPIQVATAAISHRAGAATSPRTAVQAPPGAAAARARGRGRRGGLTSTRRPRVRRGLAGRGGGGGRGRGGGGGPGGGGGREAVAWGFMGGPSIGLWGAGCAPERRPDRRRRCR